MSGFWIDRTGCIFSMGPYFPLDSYVSAEGSRGVPQSPAHGTPWTPRPSLKSGVPPLPRAAQGWAQMAPQPLCLQRFLLHRTPHGEPAGALDLEFPKQPQTGPGLQIWVCWGTEGRAVGTGLIHPKPLRGPGEPLVSCVCWRDCGLFEGSSHGGMVPPQAWPGGGPPPDYGKVHGGLQGGRTHMDMPARGRGRGGLTSLPRSCNGSILGHRELAGHSAVY